MKTSQKWGCLAVILTIASWPVAAQTSSNGWQQRIHELVNLHPQVKLAKSQLGIAHWQQQAASQPLHNPQLESGITFAETTDYEVGVSQTIDWSNQRGALQDQAQHSSELQRVQLSAAQTNVTEQILLAMIDRQLNQQLFDLAVQQEQQLATLLSLNEQRQQVGETGAIDADISLLSLSTWLPETADMAAALEASDANLAYWSHQQDISGLSIPTSFWQQSLTGVTEQSLRLHPQVQLVYQRWQIAQTNVEVVRRQLASNPTFTIKAGREDDANQFGVSVAIPIPVRNSYRASVQVVAEQANALELEYQSRLQLQVQNTSMLQRVAQQYQRRQSVWRQLTSSRLQQTLDLLDKQWRTGDLSSRDYLLALRQQAESQQAGLELTANLQKSMIRYFSASNQLLSLLSGGRN